VRAARIHHQDQPPLNGNDPYPAQEERQKERKRVLREMKRIVTVVRAHAQRYRALLDENWQATDWTRPQAEQVLKRIGSVLEALPAAVKQAHERIIGERQVANDESRTLGKQLKQHSQTRFET
jgi:hypothetical protein